MMRLLPNTATVSGKLLFKGRDLATMKPAELRSLRGDRISMVFQDPLTSLDPSYGVGAQVAETVRAHQNVSERAARQRALDLLKEVGIPAADERYSDPPHRFSGGMRQRVVIATALANDPDLLLADEPTTALDVTIQAQILALLQELRDRRGMTIVLHRARPRRSGSAVRPRWGHVRRSARRDGGGRGPLPRPVASLYPGASGRPSFRAARPWDAEGYRRPGPRPGGPASRVPVQSSLPPSHGCV